MKRLMICSMMGLAMAGILSAQGPRTEQLGAVEQPIGEPGVVRYTTWETGFAEAQRSNRPIFFFAAAAQLHARLREVFSHPIRLIDK